MLVHCITVRVPLFAVCDVSVVYDFCVCLSYFKLKGYFTFKKTFGHFIIRLLVAPGTVFMLLDSVFRYFILGVV